MKEETGGMAFRRPLKQSGRKITVVETEVVAGSIINCDNTQDIFDDKKLNLLMDWI